MKIVFDLPDVTLALTNVFYMDQPDTSRKLIWSWTIAPEDGKEYRVVRDQSGYEIVEKVDDADDIGIYI